MCTAGSVFRRAMYWSSPFQLYGTRNMPKEYLLVLLTIAFTSSDAPGSMVPAEDTSMLFRVICA